MFSSLPDLQKERGFPHPSRKKKLLQSKRESTLLKKLVLDAGATGFQDQEKGGREPVGPSGRMNCARRARPGADGCIIADARGPKK
jgi:hypothetical protein